MTNLEAVLRERVARARTPISLLTLSACSTAAGGGALARAPLGLASVAFRSGARSVLASLWRADDRATARLTTVFYEALLDGSGRAAALASAQRALIADDLYAAPQFWANFILIGDWR
jgi:CHAT domain-containing protein